MTRNMSRIRQLFAEHPSAVGESYFQHMRAAHGFAFRMLTTGVLCFIHGLFPFLFTQTASRQIKILHDVVVTNRHQGCETDKTSATAPVVVPVARARSG